MTTTQASIGLVHAISTLVSQPYRIVPIRNIMGYPCSIREGEEEKMKNLCPETISARQVTPLHLSSTTWQYIILIQDRAPNVGKQSARHTFLVLTLQGLTKLYVWTWKVKENTHQNICHFVGHLGCSGSHTLFSFNFNWTSS